MTERGQIGNSFGLSNVKGHIVRTPENISHGVRQSCQISPRVVLWNLVGGYFAEKRNTVCERKTAFGFSSVLGKFG